MENQELYPALIDYIYDYECRFMTKEELLAASEMVRAPKDITFELLKKRGVPNKYLFNDMVKQMIIDGFDAFTRNVAERIYNEHKSELILNLCSRCGKVARTPIAKQCRFCLHDWHHAG